MTRALVLTLCLLPMAGAAVTLDLPASAELTMEDRRPGDTTAIATGAMTGGTVPMVRPDGEVVLQAWRLPGGGLTTRQILDPLARQLEEAGYETLLDCADLACGGFDFRFALDVLPAPQMSVSLGDFRYYSAASETGHVALLVSRTSRAGFVQITRVGPEEQGGAPAVSTRSPEAASLPLGDLGRRLEEQGRVVLPGLDFASGAASLQDGPVPALADLADYLQDRPGRRVALVGHTDAEGGRDGNIALSRRRAEAVRQRLIAGHGVAPDRLLAEGLGYFAPSASNLSPEGRTANRRVEAVLLATE